MLNRRTRIVLPLAGIMTATMGGCSLWHAPAESRVTLLTNQGQAEAIDSPFRMALGPGLGAGDQLGQAVHFNDVILAGRLGVDLYNTDAIATVPVPAGD